MDTYSTAAEIQDQDPTSEDRDDSGPRRQSQENSTAKRLKLHIVHPGMNLGGVFHHLGKIMPRFCTNVFAWPLKNTLQKNKKNSQKKKRTLEKRTQKKTDRKLQLRVRRPIIENMKQKTRNEHRGSHDEDRNGGNYGGNLTTKNKQKKTQLNGIAEST